MKKQDFINSLHKMPVPSLPKAGINLGERLSAERLKKNQTLESASLKTRIPKKLLESLEANRFEEFSPAYLRGFVKSYCDFLELDFDTLWKASFPQPKAEPPQPAPTQEPLAKLPAQEPSTHVSRAEKPLAKLALAALALAPLLLILRSSFKGSQSADSAYYIPLPLRPINLNNEFKVSLSYRSVAWAWVNIDGETKFEGRMPSGSRQEWNVHRELLVRTSHPESLSVSVNGIPHPLAPGRDEWRIESP